VSFGDVIATARKKKGLSQKQLAAMIPKEDGEPISPQYLNDLERDRRNPPAGSLLDQFASRLDIPRDYLYLLARELPQDVDVETKDPQAVEQAFASFRRDLTKG